MKSLSALFFILSFCLIAQARVDVTETASVANADAETAAASVSDTASASVFYIAPQIGSMSVSQSNGAADRQSYFSYGGEAYYLVGRIMMGLNYSVYDPGGKGNQSVSVKQEDQWLSAQGNYLFLNEDISPYAGFGAGTVFKTITTQVMGTSETVSGTYVAPDLGLGVFGRLSPALGFNVGAKYYWYSDVTGWDYTLSFGFLTN